jgi:hypothetical protein
MAPASRVSAIVKPTNFIADPLEVAFREYAIKGRKFSL